MVRYLWRQKKLTLAQAADACGMKKGTFYGKVRRAEESDNKKGLSQMSKIICGSPLVFRML